MTFTDPARCPRKGVPCNCDGACEVPLEQRCVYTRAEELAKQYTRQGKAYPSYLGLMDAMREAEARGKKTPPEFAFEGEGVKNATEHRPDSPSVSGQEGGESPRRSALQNRRGPGSFSLTGQRREVGASIPSDIDRPATALPFGTGLDEMHDVGWGVIDSCEYMDWMEDGAAGEVSAQRVPFHPKPLQGWAAHPLLCGGEEDCR